MEGPYAGKVTTFGPSECDMEVKYDLFPTKKPLIREASNGYLKIPVNYDIMILLI